MEHHSACKNLLSSLSDYVDGVLSESLCAELERHLQECENCQIVVNTLRKTVELYHPTTPPDVPEDVRARLFLRLNLEDYMEERPSEKDPLERGHSA